jgi:hypothetical protein
MRKKLFAVLAKAILTFGIVNLANASLIGNTATLSHRVPDETTIFDGPLMVTVTAGNSDRTLLSPFAGGQEGYGVDIDASSIAIDFIADVGFTAGISFHGLVIEGLDFQPGVITSVDVTSNNLDLSRVSFDDHIVRVNWQGLSVSNGTVFTFDLQSNQSVPEPEIILLLGTGIAGLLGTRLKRKNGIQEKGGS